MPKSREGECKDPHKEGSEMNANRSCHWMSGPSEEAELSISATRWWLAISRDVLGKAYRRQMSRGRPPVGCDRTPTFVSPLGARKL